MLKRESNREKVAPRTQMRIRSSGSTFTSRFSTSAPSYGSQGRLDSKPTKSTKSSDQEFHRFLQTLFPTAQVEIDKSQATENVAPENQRFPSVDELRNYIGKWIAIKSGKIIYSNDNSKEIISYLKKTDQKADSMFRVPTDPSL